MTTKLLFHEFTRTELRALAPNALVVLPTGAIEQHGPHLPVGTDFFAVEHVARTAAAEAAAQIPVLVTPTMPFGSSHHHLPFGGTMSLSTETYFRVIFDLAETPDDALQVKVVAQKYWWAYEYPQASEEFPHQASFGLDGDKPIVTANELHVPAGQRVLLTLTSTDVIHSFWVPAFLQKRDMIPGKTNRLQIVPTQTGEFQGKCAELCGAYHSQMLFNVKVVEREEYDAHMEELKKKGQTGLLDTGLNREAVSDRDQHLIDEIEGTN